MGKTAKDIYIDIRNLFFDLELINEYDSELINFFDNDVVQNDDLYKLYRSSFKIVNDNEILLDVPLTMMLAHNYDRDTTIKLITFIKERFSKPSKNERIKRLERSLRQMRHHK